MTRDRVAYDATWNGRRFTLVDTGGWEPSARGLAAAVAEQAQIAVELADAVLFVLDATVGATDADDAVAGVLQRSSRPVVLAVNKVDDVRLESDTAELWSLGLGEPFPVSALHGRGSGDLLDALLAALPTQAPPVSGGEDAGPRRVALLGRPNVGKSSLLNRLVGSERSIVDAAAGTTRDPVDSLVDLGGDTWRFVDTAGLRRRVREAAGAEYYSSLRTETALRSAEVALVLLDAGETPLRARPADPVDGGRGRARGRHRVQQVGPGRRGPALRSRARDRARSQPYPMGAAGQRLGPHRPRGRQACVCAAYGAGRLGDAGADRPAELLAR